MTRPTHTLTPFDIGSIENGENDCHVYCANYYDTLSDGVRVADCDNIMYLTKDQCKANANFITHACNNHYQLLSALKASRALLQSLVCSEEEMLIVKEQINLINETIAKAEGR